MFAASLSDFHRLKSFAKILTYGGILLTTGLSIYSLRSRTVIDSEDPFKPNKFTPAGKKYLAALLLSAMITITASWIEDYAEGKISDEANNKLQQGVQQELQKELGAQLSQFDKALTVEQTEVKKNLGELSAGVQKATSQLQTSVDSTTKTIQLNNVESQAQARLTRESVRDLQLSNTVLSSFFMRLALPDAKPPKTSLVGDIHASGDSKLEKMQTTMCRDAAPWPPSPKNPCYGAFESRKRWNATFEFFSYLDPMAHLEVNISFRLSAFAVNIFVSDLPIGRNTIHDQRFMIFPTDSPTTRSDGPTLTRVVPVTWYGGSSQPGVLEVGFGLRGAEGGLEKGKTYYSRESDLVTFEAPFRVQVCDKHDKIEDRMTIKRHLSTFPTRQVWKLTIIGFEKTSDEHPGHITKEYILEPVAERDGDNCITIDYQ